MEWPAHLPIVGGGGVSHTVWEKNQFLGCYFSFLLGRSPWKRKRREEKEEMRS